MIRACIFDLDGTLVNAYPAVSRSVNHTLRTMGFKPRSHDQIKRAVGWGDRHLLAQFVGEELADKALKLYRPHHAGALVAKGGVRFLEGAQGLLRSLHADGYKLAIASNRPTKFTLIILKKLKIRGVFDVVLCADRVARPKPAPDIVAAVLRRLRLQRQEALYVGDMTIDVKTGHNARVLTAAVTTGSSTRAELKALRPHRIIAQISQVKTVLKEEKEK